ITIQCGLDAAPQRHDPGFSQHGNMLNHISVQPLKAVEPSLVASIIMKSCLVQTAFASVTRRLPPIDSCREPGVEITGTGAQAGGRLRRVASFDRRRVSLSLLRGPMLVGHSAGQRYPLPRPEHHMPVQISLLETKICLGVARGIYP